MHCIERPVEFDEERQNQFIRENQRQMSRELTEMMKSSYSTIESYFHSMGKVQKLGAWVPHTLNDNSEN